MSAEDSIHALCERFYGRLRDCRSRNVQNYVFFPNGTAKKVFQTNQQDLREVLRAVCRQLAIPAAAATIDAVVASILLNFNNILATLLWIRVPNPTELLDQFLGLVPELTDGGTRPLITDADLPLTLDDARDLFPTHAQDFYDEQFRFCAVTLKKREEVIYKDEKAACPLPYLKEAAIAEGSFGRVFCVRIEGQHLVSQGSQSVNTEPMDYARKDFPLEQTFQGEQAMLRTILRQLRSHQNVLVALASLQYGDKYSLFFPLAACNLWDYLYGVYDPSQQSPSGTEARCSLYRRGVALASALAFLHHEFRSQRFESLSCYHLDLKPHNILVFEPYTSNEIWKITDFGLSRVKGRSNDGAQEVHMLTPFLRKTRRVRPPREELTRNPRGEGTYLAPECAQRNGRVSSASDVWSFGCIFSLVMTYLDGGHEALQEFRQQRQMQEDRDAFYVMKNNTPQVSPVVTGWFAHLRQNTRINHSNEVAVVQQTLDFLEKRVFQPQRNSRASSNEVENSLAKFSNLYYEPPPEPPSQRGLFGRWRKHMSSSSASELYAVRSQELKLEMGASLRGSLFSPAGDLLAFYSPSCIKTIPTSELLRTLGRQPGPELLELSRSRGSWECVALSSRYICGGLAGDSFECYIYPISPIMQRHPTETTVVIQEKRIQQAHLGAIKKVVMSKDGTWTAFLLTRRFGDGMMYLAYTPDLVEEPSEQGSSNPPSRANSSVSTGDSDHVLPGGNMIVQDTRVGSIEHVRFLGFSSDSQYLIMVAQPDPSHLAIRAWDTERGIGCCNLLIRLAASASSSESLFTSCAIFHGEPRLVILCQRRFLLYIRSWAWDRTIHTLPGNFSNMFQVFVREDNEQLIFLGDSGTDRRLRVYMMPVTSTGRPTPQKVSMTDFINFKMALDSATLIRTEKRERELLVGTAKGPFLAIPLPPDPPN